MFLIYRVVHAIFLPLHAQLTSFSIKSRLPAPTLPTSLPCSVALVPPGGPCDSTIHPPPQTWSLFSPTPLTPYIQALHHPWCDHWASALEMAASQPTPGQAPYSLLLLPSSPSSTGSHIHLCVSTHHVCASPKHIPCTEPGNLSCSQKKVHGPKQSSAHVAVPSEDS